MLDERRKKVAVIPVALLLAILFRLFLLSEEVTEKGFPVPVQHRIASPGAAVTPSETVTVVLSGPRIVLWKVRPEQISVIPGEGDRQGELNGWRPEPQVRIPKGTRLVRIGLAREGSAGSRE